MFLIALSIFIAMALAAACYFVSVEKRTMEGYQTTYPFRKLTPLPYFLVVAVLAFESFTIVPAGHMGVQVTMGTVNPASLEAGFHFVNPISAVYNVNVQLQRAELQQQSAGTKDMQQVHTDLVVNYRLTPSMVATIYKEYGLNVAEKVLGPAIGEAFKSVTGQYTSEELIVKREEVSGKILERLQAKVTPFDITVSNISLVNFGFSKGYQDSIDAKMVASQNAQRAESELRKAEIDAKTRVAQAEGEAKAIQIQAQAIQSNGGAQYVQLQWIEKWDGKMPNTVVNGSNGMMLNVGK